MKPTSAFTLDNGLRVVHHHDPLTAMVAVNVLYNVGARDESPEMTGLAHLFEHLMFGGSVNIPEYDSAIERAGGLNNAWTSNDFTNFFDVAPAVNAETLFWLESDRMLGLAFSEKSLEVQRNVVIEEFKQVCLNKPYGDLSHRLRSMLYTVHPYRYPTIGKEISHIERVTLDDVKSFFYSHYAPNNAVLAVSGNISAERVRELAEKWFGGIPRRDIAPRTYAPEPPVESPRSDVMTGRVPQTAVFVVYPMCGYTGQDYVPCDLITDILASGRSSRLYRSLVMAGDLFSDADASIAGSEEPGYLMLSGRLLRGGEDAEREAVSRLTAQAEAMVTEGVSAYELNRAVNRFESNHTFGNMSFLAVAQSMAMNVMHGEDDDTVMARYRTVTTADISRASRVVFNPKRRLTLVYRPESQI